MEGAAGRERRISNIEQGMSNVEGRGGFFQGLETGWSGFCPQITQIKRISDGLEWRTWVKSFVGKIITTSSAGLKK